ncbi:MAG: hypothetical protein PF518_10575, partial [Spirochaetaceae bacterium]|nr:hypothetical protein [Spirochaetaceae bacterium]
MINIALLLFGFIPLLIGANLLVDSASSLAKRLKISNLVIGLTVVAFGTSSPELVVNLIASLEGHSEITLGNIIGSNIFNILMILGISSMVFPLAVQNKTTWIEIPLCFLSAVVVAVLVNDIFLDHDDINILSRIDGIILLLFFIIFMVYTIITMQNDILISDR